MDAPARNNDDMESLTTRDKLVAAAAREFNEKGYLGTDSNRIARLAGFAPQTFYRHFKDKTEIFLAAYRKWVSEEYAAMDAVAAREDADLAIADIILEHHRDWQVFRKSLRLMADRDERIAQARHESFLWKLKRVKKLPSNAGRSDAALITELLAIERLADAVTDGELAPLGVDAQAARVMVADAVAKVCGMG
ncbi:MAG: TetR/AcrR family transcriptional regulator [Proteobacteria bacterium]|nr:TetR/AcrR family transcriptional regulator [Pseudomonadota bacterium]